MKARVKMGEMAGVGWSREEKGNKVNGRVRMAKVLAMGKS
jgi:hypothetical protein